MPTKKNTNKLSQLYRTIDQKELSKEALDALAKLRLATANFRKQEGKEVDAFKLFFDRLIKNKPTAVKTTPEYKAMLKERRSANGRKAMEARKAKQESRQGQGSEEDSKRPAKPFGWRLRGKHNYRKPTRADIRSGKAYYEARINRADTNRTKFPMLERGGFMAKGGEIGNGKNGYVAFYKGKKIDVYADSIYGAQKTAAQYFKAKKEYEVNVMLAELDGKQYIQRTAFADGGFMADGGAIKVINISDDDKLNYFIKKQNRNNADDSYINDMMTLDYKGKKFYSLGYDTQSGGQVFPLEEAQNNAELVLKIFRGEYDVLIKEVGGNFPDKDFVKKTYVVMTSPLFPNYMLREMKYSLKYADGGFMAKGGKFKDATYISNRNIQQIVANLDGKEVKVTGKDIFDGVYLKKLSKNTAKVKFNAQEIATELSNMAYDIWDKLKIESGSQIYASKPLQIKLAKYFELEGIDEKYLKLTPKQRIAVSEVLTDENQHSLNNYLALRGYRGEEEYQGYVRMFDQDTKRPYVINPDTVERKNSNFGFMADGGEVDKGGMIYALREFISSGTIANKTDVMEYNDIAKIRTIAIQYYMDNGDVPYSMGELDKIMAYANDKLKSGIMAKGGVFYTDSHKQGH